MINCLLARKNATNTKLLGLHEGVENIFQPLSEIVHNVFMVDICRKKWKRRPALILCSYDFPEEKDM